MVPNIIRRYYHVVRYLFIGLTAKVKGLLLKKNYRFEYTFFEDIRRSKYRDLDFNEMRIRSMAHQIDKTLTTNTFKTHDKLKAALEGLIRETATHPACDKNVVEWAERVLANYELRKMQSTALSELPSPDYSEHARETLKDIVESRRSIRRFKPTKIPGRTLFEILNAGLWAPTGCNRQGICYLLLEDKNDIEFCQRLAGEVSHFPTEAPVCVVVMADPRNYALPSQRHMAYLEGGAAIECVLLTAYSFNIGSCWLHWADIKGKHAEFLRRFHLKPWLIPVGMVCLGYIEKMPLARPERKDLNRCVYTATGTPHTLC